MKRDGKASILVIIAVAGLIVLALILFVFGSASPAVAASDFMDALARGDVGKLTSLTYLGNDTKDQIQKQWQRSVDYGKYYRFTWSVTGDTRETSTTASAAVTIVRNADKPASYPEQKELPLVLRNGKWMVDVGSMDHTIFPDLPKVQ